MDYVWFCVFKGSYCLWIMFGFVFLRDHTVYGLCLVLCSKGLYCIWIMSGFVFLRDFTVLCF